MSGNLIEADEAARIGIYNQVVPSDLLEPTVTRWSHDLASGAPATLASTKQWIDRCSAGQDLWIESADASAAGRFTDECVEGLRAFAERREPRWTPET